MKAWFLKMKLNRVYHCYEDWEEIPHNMWGEVDDREGYFNKAIMFTSDHKLYGSFMRRVINEWPVSCENALTDCNINRKAWIGHAACALAFKCPEDIVRRAWGELTDVQKSLANKEAERSIADWENSYRESKKLREDLGGQVLLFRDT